MQALNGKTPALAGVDSLPRPDAPLAQRPVNDTPYFLLAAAANSLTFINALSVAALAQSASLGVESGYWRPISLHAARAASVTRL